MTAEKLGQAISLRPVPAWDARCRQAHASGRVVLFCPAVDGLRWGWCLTPEEPGDDLPMWPEVRP